MTHIDIEANEENDDFYIEELKTIFDKCAIRQNGDCVLSRAGLKSLLNSLDLVEHLGPISEKVFSNGSQQITFAQFKDRFISALPELIDLDEAEAVCANELEQLDSARTGASTVRQQSTDVQQSSTLTPVYQPVPSEASQQQQQEKQPGGLTEPMSLSVDIKNKHDKKDYDSDSLNEYQCTGLARSPKAYDLTTVGLKSRSTADERSLAPPVTEAGTAGGGGTSDDVLSGEMFGGKAIQTETAPHANVDTPPSNHDRSALSVRNELDAQEKYTSLMTPPVQRRADFILNKDECSFEAIGTGDKRLVGTSTVADAMTLSPTQQMHIADRAALVEQIQQLGLATDGYLTAYELRILHRHLASEEPLIEEEDLLEIFEQACAGQSEGRVGLDSFLDAACGASPSRRPRRTASVTEQRRSRMMTDFASDSRRSTIASTHGHQSITNYFTYMETEEPGYATLRELESYWAALGVTEGAEILEALGMSPLHSQSRVDLCELSRHLERELSDCTHGSEVLVAALLTYKAELVHLKSSLEQSQLQVSHFSQELQNVHARNALLVDELDQSQASLERSALERVKTVEDRCEASLRDAEARLSLERERWSQQLIDLDDAVGALRSNESRLKEVVSRLEKENGQLRAEVDTLQAQLQEWESEVQRRLSSSVGLLQQRKRVASGAKPDSEFEEQVKLWKRKAQIHMDENKMLKDKLDELRTQFDLFRRAHPPNHHHSRTQLPPSPLTMSTPARRRYPAASSHQNSPLNGRHPFATFVPSRHPSGSRRSESAHSRERLRPGTALSPFIARRRSQLLKRRLEARLDSSEYESELEPAYHYPRLKRRLKRRDHRTRSAHRLEVLLSSEDENYLSAAVASAARSQSACASPREVSLERHLGDIEKAYKIERRDIEEYYKIQLSTMEEVLDNEKNRFKVELETERRRLRDEFESEKAQLLAAFHSEKLEMLKRQEGELRAQFDQEKRDLEIRYASERNALEREFAEHKMEMMHRLQADYETELKRVSDTGSDRETPRFREAPRTTMRSPVAEKEPSSMTREELLKDNAQLRVDLEGIRRGFEFRLRKQEKDLREQFDTERLQLLREQQNEREKIIWHTSSGGSLSSPNGSMNGTPRQSYITGIFNNHQRTRSDNLLKWDSPDKLPAGLKAQFYALVEKQKVEPTSPLNGEKDYVQLWKDSNVEKEEIVRQNFEDLNRLQRDHSEALEAVEQQNKAKITDLERQVAELQAERDTSATEIKNRENSHRTELAQYEAALRTLEEKHAMERIEWLDSMKAKHGDGASVSRQNSMKAAAPESEKLKAENEHLVELMQDLGEQLTTAHAELNNLRSQHSMHAQEAKTLRAERDSLRTQQADIEASRDEALLAREVAEAKLTEHEANAQLCESLKLEAVQYKALCAQYETDIVRLRQALQVAQQMAVNADNAHQAQAVPNSEGSSGGSQLSPTGGIFEHSHSSTDECEVLGGLGGKRSCVRCRVLETRLREALRAELGLFGVKGESGIEEEAEEDTERGEDEETEQSGASGSNQPASALRAENSRLIRRLEEAESRMLDLRTQIALAASQRVRHAVASAPSTRLPHTVPEETVVLEGDNNSQLLPMTAAEVPECGVDPTALLSSDSADSPQKNVHGRTVALEQENYLLNSRLREKDSLLQEQAETLKKQMAENIRTSELAQELYLQNAKLMRQIKDMSATSGEWADVRKNLIEFCSDLTSKR